MPDQMTRRTLSEAEYTAVKDGVLSKAPKGLTEEEYGRWWQRRGQQLFDSDLLTAEYSPAPPEGSALSRVGGALAGAAKGLLDLAAVPFSPVKAAQMGESLYQGSADQAQKAAQAFKEGRYTEAAAHGVGTIPILGTPIAQAGEQIGSGDLAGGLTNAGLLLAPSVAPAAARGVRGAVRNRAVPALEQSAATGMEHALNATTRENKVRAQRVAPEMAKRGVVERTLPNLEARAEAESAAAGVKVGEAVRQVADKQTDVLPIVERLETLKASSVDTSGAHRVVLDEGKVAAVQKIQDTLMEYGDRISQGSLNKVRQHLDEVVQRNKGFTADDVAQVKAWAARESRSVLRDELSQANPSIDAVMAEYAFWQNIEDVAHATNLRRVGQRGNLVPTIAGGAGAIVSEALVPGTGVAGKVGSAVIGAKLGAGLRRLFDSPGYQMLNASAKQRLADALARRDMPAIKTEIARNLAAVGAKATTTDDSRRRLPSIGSPMPAGAR